MPPGLVHFPAARLVHFLFAISKIASVLPILNELFLSRWPSRNAAVAGLRTPLHSSRGQPPEARFPLRSAFTSFPVQPACRLQCTHHAGPSIFLDKFRISEL